MRINMEYIISTTWSILFNIKTILNNKSKNLEISYIKHLYAQLFRTSTEYTCIILQPLQWLHNENDGVSNHQPYNCLLNRLCKAQTKENVKRSASLAFVRGVHRWPMNSPQQGQ